MGDVRHQSHIWSQTFGNHGRTAKTDFFLNGGDRHHADAFRHTLFTQQTKGLGGRESADSIVEGTSHQQVLAQRQTAGSKDTGVANVHAGQRFLSRPSADVHKEFMQLTDLGIAGLVLQMHRGRADKAQDRFVYTVMKDAEVVNFRTW